MSDLHVDCSFHKQSMKINRYAKIKEWSDSSIGQSTVISVTWSNKGENLSNCWSNGEKLTTFATGNIKGSDHCYIGDLHKISGWYKTHLTGCIGEITVFHETLKD